MQAARVTLTAATKRADGGAWLRLEAFLERRIWLPRLVYAAIPWIYLGAGMTALLGALYLPDWAWTFPYLALLGLACLHAAGKIASVRHRRRNPE
jgi:hypothetical protein